MGTTDALYNKLSYRADEKMLIAFYWNLVFAISLGLLAFLVISGCSGGDRVNIGKNLEKVEENTLTRISDIPFLQSSKINIESSLIMGEGKSWSGQLLVLVPEIAN